VENTSEAVFAATRHTAKCPRRNAPSRRQAKEVAWNEKQRCRRPSHDTVTRLETLQRSLGTTVAAAKVGGVTRKG